MKIAVFPLDDSEIKPLYSDPNKLRFCELFTDRMFTMVYNSSTGWQNPEIKKNSPFQLTPSTIVLHYGQEIFEGLKAFRACDGSINFFRPEENAKRFNRSAKRMCMPTVPEEDFLESIETLISLEERWVPNVRGTSLYIRPFMFATDTKLGVRASSNYIFCVILSPVGQYYPEGFNPISLFVTENLTRAVKGGIGEAKTGANYAASLLAGQEALKVGCSQVLWLDGLHHRFVEEVGAMNIFFVYKDVLVTPRLNGSILPGITRDSVLTLGKHLGFKTEEREISIDEVVKGINSGEIMEVFGSGTAASISPVGNLKYKYTDNIINNGKVGTISLKLYNFLLSLQYGEIEDPFGWIRKFKSKEFSGVA
ncbi:branched-chain amino acid aminotransferase [bacterium]|nr:branched-chain amino acid aminotransferase [bacterium]